MLVFVLSIAGLWWLLEAAAWRWSSRNFMVLVAGPGEVLVTLQGHWWLSDGCSHLLTAPSQGWLFPDVPFFGFLPQTSPGFAREEVLGCPAAEGDGAALWAVSHPCPSCIPLEKPESFLWNVAQGCFFLQNESELVQFSCKTLSCLRGPLFKNKDTLKTNFPPQKNSFGGWDCH